jgi:5'-methylthioadenosine phosphorylase
MGKIGVIGGSGLYNIEGIKNIKEVSLTTPFGRPSGKLITGRLEGREVVFLPRHGKGHFIPPNRINYRANIFAMKKLGVERIISISACGSLKEELPPMDFVVADQFVDRTNSGRQMSFFAEEGLVAHIEFAHPVCAQLSGILYAAGKSLSLGIHPKGTYINMEGPAFSTLAESSLYRQWGIDIIGMTNFCEAKLAREAEICYATLAAVTDYDCWHPQHASVTIEMIISNLQKNIENSKRILLAAIKQMPRERDSCRCASALQYAIITDRKLVPQKLKKDLQPIIGKYISSRS